MVFKVASEVPSTARTREANARSTSEVCLEYSHGLPSLPGTLTAEVLKQFSEELVATEQRKQCVQGALCNLWCGATAMVASIAAVAVCSGVGSWCFQRCSSKVGRPRSDLVGGRSCVRVLTAAMGELCLG